MVKVLNRDKIQRMSDVAGGGGTSGGSGSFDPSMLMGLVDLTSEQTITGQKTFASQILSTVATGTAPFSIASTTLVSNLNADLLDGVHASGLFTALAMDSNALSITIGGTTKSLTVGYATKAAQDDEGNTIKTTYLKKTDADTTYLKIAFFSRLFQAYNGNTAVNPNDLTTTIDNIKAMFGFWTDFYLSALGSGGPSTPSFSLASLSDVDVTGVTNGQALVYNSTSAKWVPGTISSGVDMNVVWSALAAATNEQINASHLTTAAAGFFTSLTMSGNDLSITIGGTNKTLTVGYAKSASSSESADYLSSYDVYGNSNLECLQSAFASLPKDVGTAIMLHHGSASMAFGWFLGGYDYAHAYGGWFISDYGVPSWVGVDNGNWNVQYFITSANIGSQSVNYAATAGSAPASDVYAWAKASVKPSYSFSELTSHPTTISGYGITDAITTANIGNQSVNYATSAGSASTAGSATYASYIYDSSNSTPISVSWAETALSSATYLCAWNGYHIGNIAASNVSVGSAAQLTTTRTIWGQNFNGTANVTGDLYLNGSNLGLYGTPGWSNSCYISGYYSSGYKIGFSVGGTAVVEISSAGVYSTSGVTCLSDIRFKNVVERMDIDVKRIAEMSIIKFLWNDRDDGGKLHVGCVAQEWESLLPWTVQEVNGKKSLDYSVAALVSAVAVARKVESHEERIARLERELAKERELMTKN